LPMEVSLRDTKTVYTRLPIPFLWLILAAGAVVLVIRRAFRL
jgi:hypothetical protein